jgi:exosortase
MQVTAHVDKRDVLFLAFTAAFALVFLDLWREFFSFLLGSGLYNYMVLIPGVSAYLLISDRRRLRAAARSAVPLGAALAAAGALGLAAAQAQGAWPAPDDRFSLVGVSLLLIWVGGFAAMYGPRALRAAIFPLLFLLFMVPVPGGALEGVIRFLQVGSTEAAHALFALSGVPVLREGFVFHLPGQSIEVAPECSGIRSGISLVVTSVLAGHLFLRTLGGKLAMAVATLPVTMFKNGVRIVSLSLLGVYVDPRILQSELHRSGGIPFFVVALLMMVPVWWGLRTLEKRLGGKEPGAPAGGTAKGPGGAE